MNDFKRVLAIILSVSLLNGSIVSYAAEEIVKSDDTEISAVSDSEGDVSESVDFVSDEETAEEINDNDGGIEIAEGEAGVWDASGAKQAPGFQTDLDTGEPTINDDGYITSTYGYSIHEDPFNTKQVLEGKNYSSGSAHLHDAYWLKDENFFGKWDSSSESWSLTGKLNYDEYPDLVDVENAAKNGDYEQAKLALYNYYIMIDRQRGSEKEESSSKTDIITADLLTKNFMYNSRSGITPINILKVGNEECYRSVDVTSTVSKYVGNRQNLTFWILATDKNGDSAVFNSKDAGEDTAPYIRMRVNGTERIVYASEDTNICGGSNSSAVFGKSDKLVAREDAINDGNTLVNENTSRIYIKFDTSFLKSGDTVSAATLNLYGHNERADSEKETIVFYSDDSDWKENEATYKNMTAQVVFSYDQLDSWKWNQPSGAGYRYQEELLRFDTWFDKLVKVYNYTGEEKYAYTALRQIMDYIYVRGNDIAWLKSLDVAVRSQVLPGYMMQLLECRDMTPEIFTSFLKWMYVEANGAKYFTTSGNWGTSECQGLYTIAAYFPEFTDSTAWINRVKQRYETLSNAMVMSDTVCTELAIGYIDYAISTIVGSKNVADKLGIKDYPYTEKTIENVRNMGRFLYYSSLPGISDNQVGDGYSHRGNFSSRMKYLANWLDDPHLKYAAGYGGEEPDFTSSMYPVGKKMVMRTGWNDKAWYLFTDVDGGKGNHAHPDDNSIVVMADGQYLLVDPLYGSYSSSSVVSWLKSTLGHNTVTMNGKNQYSNSSSSARGSIDRWETNSKYDFSAGNTPNTPDASTYRRSIFFLRNKFWLVNDYIIPKNDKSNKYVQAWHFLPEAGITMDDSTKTTSTNIDGVNIKVIPVMPEEYTSSKIKQGYYSEGQGSISNADYTEYEQNTTGTAVFNTVLLPVGVGENLDATAAEVEVSGKEKSEASAYELFIQDNNRNKTERYIYYLLHDRSAKSTVTVGGFTTDASMMMIQLSEDGTPIHFAAQDASFIKMNSDIVYQNDTEIAELSVKRSGQICEINGTGLNSSDLAESNFRTMSGKTDVKKVLLNQDYISCSSVDGMIYLGTAPSPKPSTAPTPAPTKPSHGSGSGGGGGGGGGISKPSVTPQPTQSPQTTDNEAKQLPQPMKEEISTHWAKNEITELYENGIVTGISDTSLGLDAPVTRAQFAALIIRTMKLDISEYSGAFEDVKSDDWYAGFVQTAYDNKIMSGDGGCAYPDRDITREEMAVMLSNIIGDVPKEELVFGDDGEISSWADEAVKAVTAKGLMKGTDENRFEPKRSTTRAESFVVIYRYLHM